MRKWIVVFISVFIISWAIPIPAPTSPARAQDDEFLTYTDHLFSVQYPVAWQLSTVGDFTGQLVVVAPEPVTFPFEDGNVDFANPSLELALLNGPVVGILAGSTGSEELDVQAFAEDILAEYDVTSTESSGLIQLGETEAYEVIGTVAAGDYTFGAQLILATNADHYLIYIAGGLQEVFEEYRETFAHITQSLQLLDGTPLDAPAPDLTAGGQAFASYTGDGYTIAYPEAYQPAMVETADGTLTVFSATPTTITGEDFAVVVGFADDEGAPDPLSPLLTATVLGGPIAGVLTTPLTSFDFYPDESFDPAIIILQDLISEDAVVGLDLAHPIRLGGMDAAELSAVVSLNPDAGGPEFGVYALMVVHDGWVIAFGASAPIDQWTADQQAIFMNMAYSLVLTELPTIAETE